MALDKINLADLALILEKSPDYRVLRRLVPRTEFIPGNEQPTKTGILLDVEPIVVLLEPLAERTKTKLRDTIVGMAINKFLALLGTLIQYIWTAL